MTYFLKTITKNYANFSDRARRKEFWAFAVCFLLIFTALLFVGLKLDKAMPLPIQIENVQLRIWWVLTGVFTLWMLIPFLAVSVRRLHDAYKSGWYLLLLFIPIVGWFILLVFCCKESYWTDNRWGLNPTRTSYDEGRPEPKSLGRRRRRR